MVYIMSNLTYNPNINIPYHDRSDRVDNRSYDNRSYDNDNTSYDNTSYNRYNNHSNDRFNKFENYDNYEMNNNYMQPMDPRADPPMNNYKMKPRFNPQKQPKKLKNTMNKSKMNFKNNDEDEEIEDTHIENNEHKINWITIIKKLVIYTALFLIMSHVKMDELVCRFIPFLNNNQILCMSIKGLILGILIILTQILLK